MDAPKRTVVRFNAGNLYTRLGQRIVAVQEPDGTVHFNDVSRMVDGTITEGSCLYGADPGTPSTYAPMPPRGIRAVVEANYARSHRYRSGSPVGRALRWEDGEDA